MVNTATLIRRLKNLRKTSRLTRKDNSILGQNFYYWLHRRDWSCFILFVYKPLALNAHGSLLQDMSRSMEVFRQLRHLSVLLLALITLSQAAGVDSFFPFGLGLDESLPIGDNSTSNQINLDIPIVFYTERKNSVWVSLLHYQHFY